MVEVVVATALSGDHGTTPPAVVAVPHELSTTEATAIVVIRVSHGATTIEYYGREFGDALRAEPRSDACSRAQPVSM